jgi:putative tricarboxylic transport membrane protein
LCTSTCSAEGLAFSDLFLVKKYQLPPLAVQFGYASQDKAISLRETSRAGRKWMSESVQPASGQRNRLTTGHHTIDFWAGILPLLLALLAWAGARNFPAWSGLALFLWGFCAALAVLGVVIIALRVHVPNHRDYYGGLALLALALFAYWAGSDLAGMRGFSFGAGTAPRLFAGALAVVAAVITVQGLVTEGEPIGGYAVRGPLFITLAVMAFAFLIRGVTFEWGEQLIKIPPFGLIIASFVTFVVSAVGSKETRWTESIITAAAITAFCWLLFVKLLGLPFQLWPFFLPSLY